ncbi:30S ribosomal protein S20, partial [Amaricoccus sp.]|uniref:30S ribosomal protein S20 n=1 Tax=Amaricoccus sp. TaxID=1872485 RepID=UPI002C55E6B1
MANSPSSKKRARQTERRTAVNKARRSRMRTFVRKVEEALSSGDQAAAAEALRLAQPEIMRSVSKARYDSTIPIMSLCHRRDSAWS